MKKLTTSDSTSIRKAFLDFFAAKQHRIVPSAPMVVKDDPTLMFTNAGMNQFKDYFLGNKAPLAVRIADTQKCLRVSGKHNDLEEVGRDSYHHTMFEMLGNWSFGDYFKEEAIAWAWELLTEVYGLDQERLYVTVFGGDPEDGLPADIEARQFWSQWLPEERILDFGKKDNFWEMGDTGPCGPCSEIHYDMRSPEARKASSGVQLVNAGDPGVVEIWNLVFIQFNRKADSTLVDLPQQHVDTGMGFERLVRALQDKQSNYDTDIFSDLIRFIAQATGKTYTGDYSGASYTDIAMRVIADHVRALYFGIADGQLPSNTGAGYVLRRILRRAVRYSYSFLDVRAPLMFRLVPQLSEYFADVFPDASGQSDFIANVIREEEQSFLRTLDAGIKRFETLTVSGNRISGEDAFELYDTYGFPLDLTQLMADERGWEVDVPGYGKALAGQKSRSREDAQRTLSDWTVLGQAATEFVGYDAHQVENARILRYREVQAKGKTSYHIVLDKTPFYPEGGGQIGDTGTLSRNGTHVAVVDTIKENDLPIIVTPALPEPVDAPWQARIDSEKRVQTEYNHSATHLLHAALRQVLGTHVQQRGSLVTDTYLRFDFSHFQKVTAEQLREIEGIVNARIRADIQRIEERAVPIEKARAAGAMMLFGEKYGDTVRMITFDPEFSIELCGGCHVERTGRIGLFRITSESAIAAGVRRIEAVTGAAAERYVDERMDRLDQISELLRRPSDIVAGVAQLIEENKQLRKQIEELQQAQVADLFGELQNSAESLGSVRFIGKEVALTDGKAIKDLVFRLTSAQEDVVVLLSAIAEGKVQLHLGISRQLVELVHLDASQMIRTLAKEIKGGGGGQPFYASAGGSDASGVPRVFTLGKQLISESVGISS